MTIQLSAPSMDGIQESHQHRQKVHSRRHRQHVPERYDRIPSTNPGAEPPRGTKDSGSARSHSTHLETSSQKRP